MIIQAGPQDAAPLKKLVESAYRGDLARAGWTHEADLVQQERITHAELAELLHSPAAHVLIAWRGGVICGCVAVTQGEAGAVSIGMLCTDPQLQASGIGSALLAAAEECAVRQGARIARMCVIDVRESLIAWYLRKGYADTGRRIPFPQMQTPPLQFAVLARILDR
ncbi:GNAT family N-acetyltransferase [Croceicoccus sp. F390]|uniref:GNAT family N-acetyltransferase n=1 Tax=Croceicoccus esteveae TaxID=3075597 RepID=A0ABU2ZKC3_9SPHN|nr:GNAT family N-acetyltransferase [Croceicoccus sp. F390]MDT0576666.1 GNAT family N-acetyltransferase [Croceicoccus sp. F390]